MISIEFGKAELLNLDKNSMFIKIFGSNFDRDKDRIKGYWNRIYHKDTHEWEVPFCCFKDIQEMFKDTYIRYLNEPPKAKIVTDSEIINGMDFNGFYPYDYQLEGVNYMLNHPNSLLLDEQGCISGDMVVQIKADGMKATRRVKLYKLYNLFKTNYYTNIQIKCLINGRFSYIPIKNVISTGIKECIHIKLNDTYLECTPDHLILTTNGWKQACEIVVGDHILTNGELVCKNCGSTHDICQKQSGKFYGYCRKCMYKLRNGTKYKDQDIVREINDEGYVILKGKGTRDFPSYKRRYGTGILEHDHIMEMHLGRPLDTTRECVHHINGIKTDNRIENLKLVTLSEHAKIHSGDRNKLNLIQFDTTKTNYVKNGITIWLAPKESEVLSVSSCGFKNVFDIQINDNEIHNFVANSVIVHNCGKTLQIITLARYKKLHQNLKHCLIVCGINSLKYNWIKEINKFCKDEKGIILGTKYNTKGKIVPISVEETKQQIQSCPEEFFWIINIERMREVNKKDEAGNTIPDIPDYINEQIINKNLGLVVIDESHKIKNPESSQGKGILKLDKSVNKIAMTGTLLVNNPYDLYSPMKLVGLINDTKWQFEKKYVIKDDWYNVVGYKNIDQLHDILYKSSIRRTKDLLDLPDKVYKQEWLEFSSEEQSVFNQVIGEEPFRLEKIPEVNDMVTCITRMRQATVCGQLLTNKCKKSTKFDRLNDILEEARINGQKVLVFCPFTQALELGLEYCKEYKPKLVKGGMGAKIEQTVQEHENTEGFSVIFAQEATLGVGYTLTNTSIVVFLSPPWSRANYDQCSDRCHRIGQKSTVQIIDLLINNTYDEVIYKKLHGKGAMSDVVIDGKDIDLVKQYFDDMKIAFVNKDV